MPDRFFKPVDGFYIGKNAPADTVKPLAVRLQENGHTTRIFSDGTEQDEGTSNARHQFVPLWTKTELENLVKAKKYEEIQNPLNPPSEEPAAAEESHPALATEATEEPPHLVFTEPAPVAEPSPAAELAPTTVVAQEGVTD